jgi:hypothetical protein
MTFQANAHCLFDALEDAIAAAEVFSKEELEPGPYHISRAFRASRRPACSR